MSVMNVNATITIRTEPKLKQDFFDICEDMGLNATVAMIIYMKTVVREQRIPFEINSDKSLDEYVRCNEKYLQEGLDDLNNGRSKTYKAGDVESLQEAINRRKNA
jgi:DNA-damage-inducible protein J